MHESNFEIEKEKNRRSIGIVRVSSRSQRDGSSPEIQEEYIRKYAKKNNLELCSVVTLSESAKNTTVRKKYQDAMKRALNEDIKNIIFYMQDREARNMIDLEVNENLVREGKIIIHYAQDGRILHKNSPDSDFTMRDFAGVINKTYSITLRSKICAAQKMKAQKGQFPCGRPPLGYTHLRPKDEYGKEIKRAMTSIIVSPKLLEVRQVIREFELRAAGNTLAGIRQEIIREGFIVVGKEKRYTCSVIEYRLKNRFYWGFNKYNGVEYKGDHPLIIPQSILDAVALINSIEEKTGHRYDKERCFGNWITCGHPECELMIGYARKTKRLRSTGKDKVYNYYCCSNSRKVHKRRNITEEAIWKELEKAVNGFCITTEFANDIAIALNAVKIKETKEIENSIEDHELTLLNIQSQRKIHENLLASGGIDRESYKKRQKDFDDAEKKAQEAICDLEALLKDDGLLTGKDITKLLKHAPKIWENVPEIERLAFVRKYILNPTFRDKEFRYDLAKPLAILKSDFVNSEGSKNHED